MLSEIVRRETGNFFRPLADDDSIQFLLCWRYPALDKSHVEALLPIQDAGFHYSHLKKKQDYGHQAVSLLLSCNGITLQYAVVLYDKETASKIQYFYAGLHHDDLDDLLTLAA